MWGDIWVFPCNLRTFPTALLVILSAPLMVLILSSGFIDLKPGVHCVLFALNVN